MAEERTLHKPWMVAVWPGMGHVAVSAGYYLLAKLSMHGVAEFSPRELFDMDHVDVKDGLIKSGRLPRSRLFIWNDSKQQRDLLVFIGEAQPPLGRYAFSRRLLEFARELGVERVFTFAAMATQMHPEHSPRVFVAATSQALLSELQQQETVMLENGQISGLNGVLLGVAAEMGLPGICLLGEMPHIFAQFPYPAASLAVLKAFGAMADVAIDLEELTQQAGETAQKLGEILVQVEQNLKQESETEEEPEFGATAGDELRLSPTDERHIEQLFAMARINRSKAYELKAELDRLGVFELYEDRFLDLFKKSD